MNNQIIPEGYERIPAKEVAAGKVRKEYKYRYPHFISDQSKIENWKPFGYSVGVPIRELPEECIIIRPKTVAGNTKSS